MECFKAPGLSSNTPLGFEGVCQTRWVHLTFERVGTDDSGSVVSFLAGNDWPFHSVTQLSVAEAESMTVANEATRSFWICDVGTVLGLVRLLDLDDIDDGSPVFDLRIVNGHRRRGVGTAAVKWLSGYLFVEYPGLHRIEATTRATTRR